MEVQPLVQASVERPRRTEPRFVAPLNGANTICTNKCRPGQTLEMEREQLSRASPHNNILYICPNAKVIRINERNHYDGDLQKHRATCAKGFPGCRDEACQLGEIFQLSFAAAHRQRATYINPLVQNGSGLLDEHELWLHD